MSTLKNVTPALGEKMKEREAHHVEIAKVILARLGINSNEKRFVDDVTWYLRASYETGLWDYQNSGVPKGAQ
jgi:hypothetical protein